MKKALSIILFVLLFIPATMFAQDYDDYGEYSDYGEHDDSYGYQDSQESEVRVYAPVGNSGDMVSDQGDYCPKLSGENAGAVAPDGEYVPPQSSHDSDSEASDEDW